MNDNQFESKYLMKQCDLKWSNCSNCKLYFVMTGICGLSNGDISNFEQCKITKFSNLHNKNPDILDKKYSIII